MPILTKQKIVIPDGMLKAIKDGRGHQAFGDFTEDYRRGLEAALCWLSENPIKPTEEQLIEIRNRRDKYDPALSEGEIEPITCIEWQRIMFFEPGSEVPKEVEDLMLIPAQNKWVTETGYNEVIVEAFRRGQKSR